MPQNNAKELVVMVTTPPAEAEKLAQTLVDEALVACINILPQVQSVYKWQGAVVKEQESLLVIKTTDAAFAKLEKRIRELHSYDVPEIIAVPLANGSKAYLDWLRGAVKVHD